MTDDRNKTPPWVLFTDKGKPVAILPAGRHGEVADVTGLSLESAQAIVDLANSGKRLVEKALDGIVVLQQELTDKVFIEHLAKEKIRQAERDRCVALLNAFADDLCPVHADRRRAMAKVASALRLAAKHMAQPDSVTRAQPHKEG